MYLVGSTSIGQKSDPPVNRFFRWSISRITTFWAQIWNRSDPFYILTTFVGSLFWKCKYWKSRLRSVNYSFVWRIRGFLYYIGVSNDEFVVFPYYIGASYDEFLVFSCYIGLSNADPTFCIELFYRHIWDVVFLLICVFFLRYFIFDVHNFKFWNRYGRNVAKR